LSSWFQIFFKKITCHVERDGEETDKSLTYRMTRLEESVVGDSPYSMEACYTGDG